MVLRLTSMLLILNHVGGLFFFNKKKDPTDPKKSIENVDPSMLCKFVLDGTGRRLGESVSIDHDVLIIKSGSQFLGVPLKHVASVEKSLVVKGLLDFTKAYELGEKWRKESYREIDHHDHPEEQSK
jgi:hypothetical protein